MRQAFARAVVEAAGRQDVRDAVGALYVRVEAEIAARRPLCVISGRCCKFDEYGHRLFVTTMELAKFVHDRGGLSPHASTSGCPFQAGKLCSVHAHRPFGCRMFFCDPASTDWQNAAYERFHAELKQLHDLMGVEYAYVEWREALAIVAEHLDESPERPPIE